MVEEKQQLEDTLFLIPARGGSKRLVGKNIKVLNGLPLILHSIEYAKQFTLKENICVSSDDETIIETAKKGGIEIPFVRPKHLASDTASSEAVLLHAINYYERLGKKYKYLVLLQPTSPFRKKEHLINAYSLMTEEVDAVISVAQKKANHYGLLKREHEDGSLGDLIEEEKRSFDKSIPIYEINGSIYLIKIDSLRKYGRIPQMKTIKKITMPHYYSVDIDTIEDWRYCEFIIENQLIEQV